MLLFAVLAERKWTGFDTKNLNLLALRNLYHNFKYKTRSSTYRYNGLEKRQNMLNASTKIINYDFWLDFQLS
jgi:hypothetical protein